MQSIARSFARVGLLSLALCGSARCAEHGRIEVLDPFFGVGLKWSALREFATPVLGDSEPLERRELARAQAGHHTYVLVLTRIPILADDEQALAPTGHEVDSGQLLKHFGNFASPLGPASGHLSEDYPELRAELIAALLDAYASVLLQQHPDPEQLRRLIAHSPNCDALEAAAQAALEARSLLPSRCITQRPSGPEPAHAERRRP